MACIRDDTWEEEVVSGFCFLLTTKLFWKIKGNKEINTRMGVVAMPLALVLREIEAGGYL